LKKAIGKRAFPPEASRTHSLHHRAIRTQDEQSGGEQEVMRAIDARTLLKGRLALPVPEVAELLGISSAAVRLMIARGNLPGRKVGGGTERMTYIIPTGALLVWLDGAAQAASEEGVA